MNTGNDEPRRIAGPETGRIAGAVLLIAAILTVVAMSHHPSELEPEGAKVTITLGGIVHATMIVLLAASLWGLTMFAARQGFGGLMLRRRL